MKKFTYTLLICLLCFTLTACNPISFQYEYNVLAENTVSIKLLDYDNPETKKVTERLFQVKHLNYDFDKETDIISLNAESFEPFYKEISDELILDQISQYTSPNGTGIRIDYKNGEFDIITNEYIARYENDGTFKDYMGTFDNPERFEDILYLPFFLHAK